MTEPSPFLIGIGLRYGREVRESRLDEQRAYRLCVGRGRPAGVGPGHRFVAGLG